MYSMGMHLIYDTPMPSDQGILNVSLIPKKIKINPNIIKVLMVVVEIK